MEITIQVNSARDIGRPLLPLHNAYLAKFPAVLDSFYQHHKHLYRGGGGRELRSDGQRLSFVIFNPKWPIRRPHCTQTVAKYS